MTFAMYERARRRTASASTPTTTIRVMVLRGAGGKAFVAGTDIRQFAEFRVRARTALAYEAAIDARRSTGSRPCASRRSRSSTASRWAPGSRSSAACDLRVITPAARSSACRSRAPSATASRWATTPGSAGALGAAAAEGRDLHRPPDRAPTRRSRSASRPRVDRRRRGARRPSCASCSPPTRPTTLWVTKEALRRAAPRRPTATTSSARPTAARASAPTCSAS